MTALRSQSLPAVGDPVPAVLSSLADSMNWSPPRAMPPVPTGLLARVGRALFEGSPRLTSGVHRRQARLLASLNLALVVLLAEGSIVTTLLRHEGLPPSLPIILAAAGVTSAVAYGLSRTRHLQAATILTLGVQWCTPLASMVLNEQRSTIRAFGASTWLSLAILLTLGLAGLRTTVATTLACLTVPLIAGVLGLGGSAGDVPHGFAYLLSVGVLAIVLNRHRHKLEEERSVELRTRNAELIALGEHLAARRAELKQSNLALARAYADLQKNQESLLLSEKMASLGRLTAGIAHEMSSPLAAVRGALVEALALVDEYQRSIGDRDVGEEDHRAIAADLGKSLALADKAAERASSFVRNIKARTRDVGAHEQARFDAVSTIREALQMLGHDVTRSKSRVVFEPAEERIQIVGSPGKLSQVVTNLVSNGLDANLQRGGGTVRVDFAREGADVVLTVSDEGPGIPPQDLPRIFEPLFTTKPIGQGTGLGLTIVHDIVLGDFRGHIDVGAAPGGGARFTVRLPSPEPG